MTAFRATYSDWRLVKTRGVVQVIFEVPLEGAGQAYDVLGGMPQPSAEVWCAIARLQQDKERKPKDEGAPASTAHDTAPMPATRKPPNRLAKQAGMACCDPVFHKFLNEHDLAQATDTLGNGSGVTWEDIARVSIYDYCDVESRADIIPGTHAAAKWDELWSKFTAWKIAG